MKNRAIALTAVVFGAVGPLIGAVVIWFQQPPGRFQDVLLLSYVFGGIPALVAGVTYEGLRARGNGFSSAWYTRALLGGGAGLFGCLVFFLLTSVYDLLTVPNWTVGDLETRFLRRLVLAGIPAGIICALLTGVGRARNG